MTMEGNPLPAAEAVQRAKRLLDDAMMTLLSRGDLPAAYEAVRDAQGFLDAVRTELFGLARVNGCAAELDALEDRDEDPVCPSCFSSTVPVLIPDETFTRPVVCADPWHSRGEDPGYIGKGHTGSSIRRDARLTTRVLPVAEGETCIIEVAPVPGSRHLTDPRALNHGGRTIEEQEDVSDGLRCPACLSPYTSARGGVPSGGTAVQCTHVWHRPLPVPDPDRKPASTLLASASLAGWDPADDLAVELIDPPALAPGRMHTGEQDRGVRVTHKPTGTIAEASSERSQIQNRALAITRLREHPNVLRYLVNQRCTHGADCLAHPGTGGLHNYDGGEAADLPAHRIPGDKRDPR
jgi:hypothetical protein